MTSETTFRRLMAELSACLPSAASSEAESNVRLKAYSRSLHDLEESDLVEACNRILFEDTFFPSIARIRAVAEECGQDRRRRDLALAESNAPRELTCPTCHGARFVRRGGYDALNVLAGESSSRTIACPGCTTEGRYDAGKERQRIQRSGGVAYPDRGREIDMDGQQWPDALRGFRLPDGRMDMNALYFYSRELRGLEPSGDDRPMPVSGFKTIAQAA